MRLKAEKEAKERPVFLSKKQREEMALAKRHAQVQAQRDRLAAMRAAMQDFKKEEKKEESKKVLQRVFL